VAGRAAALGKVEKPITPLPSRLGGMGGGKGGGLPPALGGSVRMRHIPSGAGVPPAFQLRHIQPGEGRGPKQPPEAIGSRAGKVSCARGLRTFSGRDA